MKKRTEHPTTRRDELNALYAQIHRMGQLGGGIRPEACHHLIAFDGALSNRNDLGLSGQPFQSNVANLYEQALSVQDLVPGFSADYFPGTGTLEGMLLTAGMAPNAQGSSDKLALQAFQKIAAGALRHLDKRGTDGTASLSVSIIALSRGSASAMALVRLLNSRGVTCDGDRQIVRPGIPVRGLVFLDPLTTLVEGAERLPDNVEGPVLLVRACANDGLPYRAHPYESDQRVIAIDIPSHHPDVAGGHDLNGPGAVVLEGTTGFLQRSGIPLGNVPASRRFIASLVSGNSLVRAPDRVPM